MEDKEKLKILNKETISLALEDNFDFSRQLLNEIIEVIWNTGHDLHPQ